MAMTTGEVAARRRWRRTIHRVARNKLQYRPNEISIVNVENTAKMLTPQGEADKSAEEGGDFKSHWERGTGEPAALLKQALPSTSSYSQHSAGAGFNLRVSAAWKFQQGLRQGDRFVILTDK